MNQDQQNNQEGSSNLEDLSSVQISDDDLEQVDNVKIQDKKAAKKRAKQLRTPEEIKRDKKRKFAIISGLIFIILITLLVLPVSRWAILNTLGFRGELVILVQDKKSFETISDASVVVDDVAIGSTDSSGQFVASSLKLGKHHLSLEKAGYSRDQQQISVETGSKKYNASLEAIGIKVTVGLKDWLAESPIAGARLKAGSSKSTSDVKGQATLILSPNEEKTELVITKEGYLTKKVELDSKVSSREVTLVANAKDYFISKRDGNFDIYSSNIDGSSQKKIIDATGKESPNFLQFTINRDNKKAILVATREGKRTNDRVVAGIYSVDLPSAKIEKIDEGSDVQILDWANDSIVYSKTSPELNYDDKNLTKIVSYDVHTGSLTTRAQSNYFQLASVVGSTLLYMPASTKTAQLTSVNIPSGDKQQYLKNKQVSYGIQSDYAVAQIQTYDSQFYEINLNTNMTTQIDRQPGDPERFALSQDGKQLAYTDKRDGKGALIVRGINSTKDKIIAKVGGLVKPVRWVSKDLIIVRIATNQETADYIVDVKTGKYTKIVDVSNVGQGFFEQ